MDFEYQEKRYRYKVTEKAQVASDRDWSAMRRSGQRLVLTTCHPVGSEKQRLVVSADMVGVI